MTKTVVSNYESRRDHSESGWIKLILTCIAAWSRVTDISTYVGIVQRQLGVAHVGVRRNCSIGVEKDTLVAYRGRNSSSVVSVDMRVLEALKRVRIWLPGGALRKRYTWARSHNASDDRSSSDQMYHVGRSLLLSSLNGSGKSIGAGGREMRSEEENEERRHLP